MRKKLSITGLVRLFVLMAIFVLMLTVIKQFDLLTTQVAVAFIAISLLLTLMDLQPILVEDEPEVWKMDVIVNGKFESHEMKRYDIDKVIWMLSRNGKFEIVKFGRIEN